MTCKRLAALALALLCLTSCASMLDREVTYTAAHEENPPTSLSGAYRVNTYAALCSALRSYVEEGMTEGSLRFPATYPGNLSVDLERARRQMMEEEPLGCYALRDITFHTARIIAYYEVTAAFDYKIPPAEYMTIETVRDEKALDERMKKALENFSGGFIVLLDFPDAEGRDWLAESLRRVYDNCPDLALGYPELTVTYYPEDPAQAVAEVDMTYPESTVVLRLRQRDMLRAAQALVDGELAAVDGSESRELYDAVMARFRYDPEGGSTAADALLDGVANDQGLARAYLLLCRLKGNEEAAISPDETGAYGADVAWTEENGERAAAAVSFKPGETQGGEVP